MNEKSRPDKVVPTIRVAVGAAEVCPVVLVETAGALGVLIAQRRCPDERLEKVLYFRVLMDEPYAIFLPEAELRTMEGYSVVYVESQDGLIYEPSQVPYAIKNIRPAQYAQYVDRIVAQDAGWVVREIKDLFGKCEGFSLTTNGELTAPENYAMGFEHFAASHSFVMPKGAKRPGATG